MKKSTVKKVCAAVIEEICEQFAEKLVWKIAWDYADECFKDPQVSVSEVVDALRNCVSLEEYFTPAGIEMYEAGMKYLDKIDNLV